MTGPYSTTNPNRAPDEPPPVSQIKPTPPNPSAPMFLSPAEDACLQLSADLWNAYIKMPRMASEGVVDDDTNDFRRAIHEIQRIIATRPCYRNGTFVR